MTNHQITAIEQRMEGRTIRPETIRDEKPEDVGMAEQSSVRNSKR